MLLSTSITTLEHGRRRQIAENRQKLQSIVDTLMTRERQNIALTGQRDSGR